MRTFFYYESMQSDAFYNTSFYEAKRCILHFYEVYFVYEERSESMKTLYFTKNTSVYTFITYKTKVSLLL